MPAPRPTWPCTGGRACVHLLEPEELVLNGGAVGVRLLAPCQLAAVAVDRGLERRQIRRGAGDLVCVVGRCAWWQSFDLLRDAEQLIVVSGRAIPDGDAGVDQRLDLVGQVREVLVLEQHLVADRAPQVCFAGLVDGDLAVGRGAAREVVAAIDLGQERSPLAGRRLVLEGLLARLRPGDLAARIGIDALGRVRCAAHALNERRLEQDLHRALVRRVRVLDVLPLPRDRGRAEHLEVRRSLELLSRHRLCDGDLERDELLLLRPAWRHLDGRRTRGVGRVSRSGALEFLHARLGPWRCGIRRLRGRLRLYRSMARRYGRCTGCPGSRWRVRRFATRDLRAQLVRLVLERWIVVGGCAADLRVHRHPPLRLLLHVGQLVAE
jgi:hypothetical protein